MHWSDIQERPIDLENERERVEISKFLSCFGLTFDGSVEYTVALVQNDNMIATGSLDGEVLRNFAILEEYQGADLTARLATHLMGVAARRGRHHFFVFTKPETAGLFSSLGFREVARTDKAVLLETGMGSIAAYCDELKEQTCLLSPPPRAALVVNCNPFTLGHQAVIAKAAAENSSVIVLVVSEEGSAFPFETRFRLVSEGLSHLENVAVFPGGKYIVSAATFPGYFTKGNDTLIAQTELDATIFARYIAPALGVTSRYVGTEPNDATTCAYNEAMERIFPRYGLSLRVMPRVSASGDDQPVSASRVRNYIREERWSDVQRLVPDTTYQYLRSEEALPVLKRLKASIARH